MENNFDCQCEACRAGKSVAEIKRWEEERLKNPGWFIHAIGNDENYPFNVNFHTHGLQENYNHLDLQLICPVPVPVVQGIFNFIVDQIKEGVVFESGQMVEGIFGGLFVKLEKAEEGEREILRVIVPDPEGSVDPWSMKSPFKKQYFDIVEFDDDEDEELNNSENHEDHDWFSYRREQ